MYVPGPVVEKCWGSTRTYWSSLNEVHPAIHSLPAHLSLATWFQLWWSRRHGSNNDDRHDTLIHDTGRNKDSCIQFLQISAFWSPNIDIELGHPSCSGPNDVAPLASRSSSRQKAGSWLPLWQQSWAQLWTNDQQHSATLSCQYNPVLGIIIVQCFTKFHQPQPM